MSDDNTTRQDHPTIEPQENGKLVSPARHAHRYFRDSHSGSDPDVREFAEAIENYKLQNRRRFLTFEEILQIVKSLGYHK